MLWIYEINFCKNSLAKQWISVASRKVIKLLFLLSLGRINLMMDKEASAV